MSNKNAVDAELQELLERARQADVLRVNRFETHCRRLIFAIRAVWPGCIPSVFEARAV
jgi:hypothetical protein